MKTRTLVAIPLLALLYLLIFVWPPVALTVALSAASALCAYELSRAFVKRPWLNVLTAAVAAYLAWDMPWLDWEIGNDSIFYFVSPHTHSAYIPAVFLCITCLITYLCYKYMKTTIQSLLGCMTFSLFSALAIPIIMSSLRQYQEIFRVFTGGFFPKEAELRSQFILLMPFLIAVGTDTCAYLVGRAIGKHKMAPVVSPNKTWEGAAGGLLGGVLFLLIYALIPIDGRSLVSLLGLPWILSCGLLGAVAAQAGDLCFSALKRKAGIKDFGNLLPGHGGLLDRLDSLLFVIPTVAFWGSVWMR